jgi:G3E family GTPase
MGWLIVKVGWLWRYPVGADDNLKDHLQLDAVLCVVDAKHCLQHIQKDSHGKSVTNEAVQQIAFADKILLNKVHAKLWKQSATHTPRAFDKHCLKFKGTFK